MTYPFHSHREYPHLTTKQVIDHYNRGWQNIISTQGKVGVKLFTEMVSGNASLDQYTNKPQTRRFQYSMYAFRTSTNQS